MTVPTPRPTEKAKTTTSPTTCRPGRLVDGDGAAGVAGCTGLGVIRSDLRRTTDGRGVLTVIVRKETIRKMTS